MKKGIALTIIANLIWGLMPVYWKLFPQVSPWKLLAFRILCSFCIVGGFLLLRKNTGWLRIFLNPEKRLRVILSGLVISFNWGLYIWAVNNGHTIESSLGYYIHPVMVILMGLCLFREKLLPLQWGAFISAVIGVGLLTGLSGTFPWISLGLALSFSFYGLIKKELSFDPLDALGAETLAASPIAVVLLCLNIPGLTSNAGITPLTILALIPSGLITSIPLYCFARGTRLLPLSNMGFIQFISPTFQFLLGVFIYREAFPLRNLIPFGFIWLSVILYSVSLLARRKGR
ncbi:MAG: EamA family transporter RarD [Treponema sp.]|jgi:chloramphenicol-sensitive protein RarD|nr:EamA family transporter RarD [Treponema sp.]